MEKIKTVERNSLFNITDKYDVYEDDGYYGICRKGETITHCGYETLEAALRSKQMPERTIAY